MSITLEQLSARMRQGEQVPLRHTAQVALTLSIPSILQQIVVTAMEYIDAAMVGHIGAAATASIGIVSSSTWLLHGMLAGLCMAFSIQVAQYLGADRQQDARGVLRQSMLFNLAVGLAAAAFGIGISRFLPGWLGADAALQANASAYFAIWSASLPFIMAMGTYAAMLRSTGDALTPGLISIFTCVLDIIFNFSSSTPRGDDGIRPEPHGLGSGLGRAGRSTGTALANAVGGTLALGVLLLRDGPLCIRKPGSWHITRACCITCEGGRTAGSRARCAVLGTGAAGAHRVRAGHYRHCRQQSGGQRREPVLHGGLRHSGRRPCAGGTGRGRKPPGHGQALCMAVHRHGHGHHGTGPAWGCYVFAPHLMGILPPTRRHCAGCAGAAHRSLCRADVRASIVASGSMQARATAPAALF